ncbi:MAG TPA: tRNA pseudouridine(55) synthase TruB [Candidatus Angelobacter sp.]|nr:tRNA pseudouridine(55) synthase TruB [Candidatus Angelobacter sp.]
MDGVIIINKPPGMTSHDVVARVRRITGERSVGHLGTLDPSARGVLPLVLGRFTRLAQFYTNADKRYEGTIQFGLSTDTYDAEGEPQGPKQPVDMTLEQVQQVAQTFVGEIQQVPPPFSAKKIGGVPAYKLARKKQEVELEPRRVEVKEFEIVDLEGEQARFRAWVSSGTYIRSLAHELGRLLGPGAHLASLVRTSVREFQIAEAHSLEELEGAKPGNGSPDSQRLITNIMLNNGSSPKIAPFETLCLHPRLILPELPAVTAPPEALAKIRHGASVNLPEFTRAPLVRVFEGQARLIAIARRIAGTLFHPKVVLF